MLATDSAMQMTGRNVPKMGALMMLIHSTPSGCTFQRVEGEGFKDWLSLAWRDSNVLKAPA